MAIINSREILPRTFSHKLGESPRARRTFVVTLSEPVGHQQIINHVGILHGSTHPEYSYLNCTNADITEPDRQHAEITYDYELLAQEFEPNPLLRPDVWSFSVSGAAVPAIYYFDDAGAQKPLTNSANQFIEGLTTEEAEVRATVSGNRATFPLALASYVANTVNSDSFLGAGAYKWKCVGISGQQTAEDVNGVSVRFYQITSELVYRASGWPLILPDIGWNYLEENKLQRAWVEFKDESGQVQRLPSANKVPLSADGRMLPPGTPCRLLVRRVNQAVPFNQYFGTPQF